MFLASEGHECTTPPGQAAHRPYVVKKTFKSCSGIHPWTSEVIEELAKITIVSYRNTQNECLLFFSISPRAHLVQFDTYVHIYIYKEKKKKKE